MASNNSEAKSVPLVKVAWVREWMEEYTWELEADMQEEFLNLFRGNNFEGKIF